MEMPLAWGFYVENLYRTQYRYLTYCGVGGVGFCFLSLYSVLKIQCYIVVPSDFSNSWPGISAHFGRPLFLSENSFGFLLLWELRKFISCFSGITDGFFCFGNEFVCYDFAHRSIYFSPAHRSIYFSPDCWERRIP